LPGFAVISGIRAEVRIAYATHDAISVSWNRSANRAIMRGVGVVRGEVRWQC